ncbi:hypothetical protein DL96DRAFT_71431 [Flagelloscypha sp. PMI_526]|nr:hypothetical protein DL96DRAFT_71431 [Flagelloscypha sp. PMI_526]
MPPRGSEGREETNVPKNFSHPAPAGLDFTPILTHYVFLGTTIAAIIGWIVAFIGQIVATAQFGNTNVRTLWFAIWLEMFFIGGVIYTLASDSIAMHRIQLSVFGAVAIVFAVQGTDQGIFTSVPAFDAMGAGWLILAMVNIIWVLYFTSEQDSLVLHILNMGGNGGLTPPSRRRTRTPSNMHNMGGPGGYGVNNYGSGGGISSADIPYDSKQGALGGPPLRSQNSFGGASVDGGAQRSFGAASLNNTPTVGGGEQGTHSPLMASSPVGAGPPSSMGGELSPAPAPESFMYKAKALYAYTASPDDPNEISFTKGEILDIVDKQGKWWQAKKADGTIGIAPSNYLQII